MLEEINKLLGENSRLKEEAAALAIIRHCLVGEYEVVDYAPTDNAFNSPYRLRIFRDEYTYSEWILRDETEYNLLKKYLKLN